MSILLGGFLFSCTHLKSETLAYKGFSIVVRPNTTEKEFLRALTEIKKNGSNAVLLKVTEVQKDWSSNVIAPDPQRTLGLEKLAHFFDLAKQKKLKTILMPVLYLKKVYSPKHWRGMIRPRSQRDWKRSYQSMIMKYAHLSEGKGVDILVIGSELVSMESETEFWKITMKKIREVYVGKLSYSFNWDHLAKEEVWKDLDFMGLNAYFPLIQKDEKPNQSKVMETWEKVQSRIQLWKNRFDKPILFLEVGYPNREGALFDPWDHVRKAKRNDGEQGLAYDLFIKAWKKKPLGDGVLFYEWDMREDGSITYSPRNKPAAKVVSSWFSDH